MSIADRFSLFPQPVASYTVLSVKLLLNLLVCVNVLCCVCSELVSMFSVVCVVNLC